MKNNLKVKTSLFTLILAFMAIGTFAIAKEVMKKDYNTVVPATAQSEEILHWFQPNGEDPDFIRSNTIDDEESASTGCVRDLEGCERGYTTSQLVNPSDPMEGVKPEAVDSPAATLGQN